MLLGQLETAVKNRRLARHHFAQAQALVSGAQARAPEDSAPPLTEGPEPKKLTAEAAASLAADSARTARPTAAAMELSSGAVPSESLGMQSDGAARDTFDAGASDVGDGDATSSLRSDGAQPDVVAADGMLGLAKSFPPADEIAPADGAPGLSEGSVSALRPSAKEILATIAFVLAMGAAGAAIGWWRRQRSG